MLAAALGSQRAAVAVYSRTSANVNSTYYLLKDSNDSVATLLDSTGAVIARESFNAYGTRRNPGTWSGQVNATGLDTSFNITRQGYTWQTALGYTSLNHMNARVQDSATGVFLSADSLISQPGYTQSYNRYGYVNNNPLSYNDPSGHCPHNNGYTPPDNNGPGLQPGDYVPASAENNYEEEIFVTAERRDYSPWDFTPFDWNLLRDWYNDYFNNNNVDSAPAKRAPQPVPQGNKSDSRLLTPCEKTTLGPYIPSTDLNAAVLHDGNVPFYLGNNFTGITRGNDIYFRPGIYDPSMPAGLAVLGHELVHVGQYRGGMNWLSYLWSTRHGYSNSPYEQAAYSMQDKIQSELTGNGFAGCSAPSAAPQGGSSP